MWNQDLEHVSNWKPRFFQQEISIFRKPGKASLILLFLCLMLSTLPSHIANHGFWPLQIQRERRADGKGSKLVLLNWHPIRKTTFSGPGRSSWVYLQFFRGCHWKLLSVFLMPQALHFSLKIFLCFALRSQLSQQVTTDIHYFGESHFPSWCFSWAWF